MNDLTNASIYPDRPVYKAAEKYSNIFPVANALSAAAFQRGTRTDKFNAASDSLSYDLAFQAVSRLYGKKMRDFYQTHPKFAEQANQHPILINGGTALAGGLVAGLGGWGVQRLQQAARDKLLGKEAINAALHSKTGNRLAKLFMPLDRLAGNRLVRAGAALGMLGFAADLIFRRIQDLSAFGKDYREARKVVPASEASPYALKNEVLLEHQSPFGA